MSDIAIRVENLSKLYHIGMLQQRHDTLRDALTSRFRRSPQAVYAQSTVSDELWALRDVSFEVKRGEVVGIIGRNGAGKSTLLKILSRITEPTSGRVELHGRVGSLLEVGTGFHPELTGRENIYLNGAILGMHRVEIDRQFDEIVAFAEIERFLDTPVKRYSSGMYVRLAFAVAAHLEPEIMIVDEVLAVGDAEFQKKCLGKMGDVASGGRTVLFVSHNMSAVQRLCARTIRLNQGTLVARGKTAEIVAEYIASDAYCARPEQWIDLTRMSRLGIGTARFVAAKFSSLGQSFNSEIRSDEPLEFLLSITSNTPRSVGSVCIIIFDQYGTKLINADTISQGRSVNLRTGENLVRFSFDSLHLGTGVYTVGLWMADPTSGPLDFIESAFSVQVSIPEAEGFGVQPMIDGVVTCRFQVEEVTFQ